MKIKAGRTWGVRPVFCRWDGLDEEHRGDKDEGGDDYEGIGAMAGGCHGLSPSNMEREGDFGEEA
jgi:hypothetical protein